MENNSTFDFVILGGGIAGLTFGLQAARRGKHVTLLESGDQAGGLARTFVYGDYRFDIGGHRFHSEWPKVTEWVLDLMDNQMLQVVRKSRIYLNGRYVDYPLELPNALSAFDLPTALRVGASYMAAAIRRDDRDADVSFEDWIVRRFGRALYDIYFRPYTEKVLGLDCREVSYEWASQRVKVPSLSAAVRGSLQRATAHPGTMISRFHYPALGFGEIPARMAAKARATGRASIELASRVTRLEHDAGLKEWRVHYRHAESDRIVRGRELVSTIPLGALVPLLPPADAAPPALGDKLVYRSLICVYLALEGDRVSQDTWTYFSDPSLLFGRIHEPPNWSPQMAPPGHTSLCLEIFCSVGDSIWQQSDRGIIDRVVEDLRRLKLFAPSRVRDSWLLRVPNAYPIYKVGYRAQLERVQQFLGRWDTLHLVGRTGAFQYLNSDGVIKYTLDLVDQLIPG